MPGPSVLSFGLAILFSMSCLIWAFVLESANNLLYISCGSWTPPISLTVEFHVLLKSASFLKPNSSNSYSIALVSLFIVPANKLFNIYTVSSSANSSIDLPKFLTSPNLSEVSTLSNFSLSSSNSVKSYFCFIKPYALLAIWYFTKPSFGLP